MSSVKIVGAEDLDAEEFPDGGVLEAREVGER